MGAQGSLVLPSHEERNPEKEARVQDQGWVPQGSGRTLGGRMVKYGGITCSWLPQQRSQLAKLGFQLRHLSAAFPKTLELTGPQQVPISSGNRTALVFQGGMLKYWLEHRCRDQSSGSRPGWMAGLQTEPRRLFVIISRLFIKDSGCLGHRAVSPDSAGAQGR